MYMYIYIYVCVYVVCFPITTDIEHIAYLANNSKQLALQLSLNGILAILTSLMLLIILLLPPKSCDPKGLYCSS